MNKQLELAFPQIQSPEITAVSSQSFDNSSTFIDNMKLPIHRWFRYSAGFSAQWVEKIIIKAKAQGDVTVLDPFAGSGTTLIVSGQLGVPCYGIEAHPFVERIAKAKLLYQTDVDIYWEHIQKIIESTEKLESSLDKYPKLIHSCFSIPSLQSLDKLRQAWESIDNSSPQSQLAWLTLISILRHVSHVGTAPWQYVLPNKQKQCLLEPISAFQLMAETMAADLKTTDKQINLTAKIIQSDARNCIGIPDKFANLVITSPPYINNYDYADATRLEMCFMQEIFGWGDLQKAVRQYLVRSCSQHVSNKNVNADEILASSELEPLKPSITEIYQKLLEERKLHGGKKNYHLMVICYFLDMARVWIALRRVCKSPVTVCFVIGDSAPYGIYIPVIEWMCLLAMGAGFTSFKFEKIRDRNVK
jgi:DNA modification methylase